MKWEEVKLGKHCLKIGSGATPKGGERVYIDSGVAFIRSQNVYNLQFAFDGLTHITDKAAKDLEGVTVNKNDILLNITGDSVARVCMVPESVLPARVNQHVAIIRTNDDFVPQFLLYYLASPYMQAYMLNLAVGKGASRNALTKGMIEDFPIPMPRIDKQQRIVAVLSVYDALIQNNQKQIKLLEEAARRLYREWFVDLRFPGHEHVQIVDGVPEGWNKVLLKDLIVYEIGGGWGEESISRKNEKEAYVIRGTDFYGITHGNMDDLPCRFHGKRNLDARKLFDGDILFEVSGGSKNEGVARTVLIKQALLDYLNKPVMCASFCKLIRTNSILSVFLYYHFQYLRQAGITEQYDKRSASSIVNYRWQDFMNQESVLIPSPKLLETYNALANPIYEKITHCSLLIAKLSKARDRLLPKLMSGEIEM